MNGNTYIMEKKTILSVRGVSKIFPGVVALDSVDFDLDIGEVHILLGENGAGKSTLVKILSGAYQKTGGKILLEGNEVEIKTPKQAQQIGIGIIYQEFNLIPYLTVAENIFLGREPVSLMGIIDRKKMFDDAHNILSDLGVKIDPTSTIKNLGVAEQQMVEVAKALSLNARILIMDEPTSALTESEIKELFKTIKRLKKKSVSVIYISHRLNELFEIGDRVTVLRDGKHITTKTISNTTEQDLIRMMVARELKEQFPRQSVSPGGEVLIIKNLSVGDALKNINFTIRKGEIVGVAGLLGAGRTELARALFGVDKIKHGQIIIHGKPEKIDSPRKAINLKMGFLTEDRKRQGLVLKLSLKDNICLPSVQRFSRLGIVSGKKENEAAKKYVREFQIKTPGLYQKTMYLSGGNQQKVVMSKWLCTEADILIFDEPTRGIDVGSKVEIYKLMNDLTAEGVAILMISSDLPEILGMSDRILVMHNGRITAEYTSQEATQEKILHSALGAA